MSFSNIYTSVACNRTTEAADWGSNGLIVFAARNAVCIYNPNFQCAAGKIQNTFVRHSKHVNTVRWLCVNDKTNSNECYFISGSDDATAIFWHWQMNTPNPQHIVLRGHESGINAVHGIQQSNQQWLLASAAADCTIRLWSIEHNNFEESAASCLQTILLSSNGFCFTLRLAPLPKSENVLLCFSSDDESISLWSQQSESEGKLFVPVHKLTGHEDWVRGMDYVQDGDDMLLASSSQDNFIRLWRISPRTEAQVQANNVDIFNLLDATTGEIRVEEKILKLASNCYAVSLESVLYGHDGWVYGVQWHVSEKYGLRLLSASIDKTLIVWAQSEDGVWMENVRLGEVGGNSLGFFGGKFSTNGLSIMGHSFQGGFHIWKQSPANEHLWLPSVIVGGHFGEARDLAWDPKAGAYLMSLSADQTTRIHAPWLQNAADIEANTWHELARPQVHGYDMQVLALLSRYKFASGAEEKIVRTFQAPANFIENFRNLTNCSSDAEGDNLLSVLPKGASVPSLGLSNKAVYNADLSESNSQVKHIKDEYPENYFVPVELQQPPQEETLMQNTLWPEIQKLYGHGFEIYALAASPDGRLLASACKATNAEHAQIILWNTNTWKQIQKLPSHQLTVTQMRFSPNGEYLLSVSRDRRWSLFKQNTAWQDTTPPVFALHASTDKTNGVHARIIWSCDWSHDGKLFITSSRDGKVVIWTHAGESCSAATKSCLNGWLALTPLELKNESITAATFATQKHTSGAYVVALGFESGLIRIYQFHEGEWQLKLALDNDNSHHMTVKRLQFRPCAENANNSFYLASCGEDQLVRIYKIQL